MSWALKRPVQCAELPGKCKTQWNCDIHGSMCSALKRPLQCAEQFLELKICVSPQFCAIDPPNPARGFIQQNENVRRATAAYIGKCGNACFGTLACAKMYESCVGMGWGGGDHTIEGGGPGIRNPDSYIRTYVRTYVIIYTRIRTYVPTYKGT